MTCVAVVAPRMACRFASSRLGGHTMGLVILFDLVISCTGQGAGTHRRGQVPGVQGCGRQLRVRQGQGDASPEVQGTSDAGFREEGCIHAWAQGVSARPVAGAACGKQAVSHEAAAPFSACASETPSPDCQSLICGRP